jgi:hypothetical protein
MGLLAITPQVFIRCILDDLQIEFATQQFEFSDGLSWGNAYELQHLEKAKSSFKEEKLLPCRG